MGTGTAATDRHEKGFDAIYQHEFRKMCRKLRCIRSLVDAISSHTAAVEAVMKKRRSN